MKSMNINNGDVFDIGQTVNGVSKFLWFNNKWYYFEERLSNEYEYDQDGLTNLIHNNEFEEVTFTKNIFNEELTDEYIHGLKSIIEYLEEKIIQGGNK
jgi:hypothetical protein